MKLPGAIVLASLSSYASAFEPTRISFDSLLNGAGEILEPLRQDGLIAISNIPSFRSIKTKSFDTLVPCSHLSSSAVEHSFEDGTVRRTLASHTIPNGRQTISHGDATDCATFSEASDIFRDTVAEVTQAFSYRLSSMLDHKAPLLKAPNMVFPKFEDVVENGEHLEHFHTYTAGDGSTEVDNKTIEWHTDQGLFIVFTPGTVDGVPSDGFHIRTADGNEETVHFGEEDELVIMLGDGVNQYVNTQLPEEQQLRATPHALVMPSVPGAERLWYGRMVLPPVDAIHPKEGQTFGKLREMMIGKDEEAMSVGCSSAEMTSRQLEMSTCEENSLMCWHRCMPLDFEEPVSEAICAERGLELRCINPRGQLWDNTHGDFFPGCIDPNTAESATPYPSLPYELGESCASDLAVSRSASMNVHVPADITVTTDYDNVVSLGDAAATFAWSVINGEVHAALTINDIFGWLSMGFSNYLENPKRQGMYGAELIMALPGGNYSAQTGLDLSLDTSINEYVLDEQEASFRHWSTPVNTEPLDAELIEEDCYTTLKFIAEGINGRSFNLTGTDAFIWAANTQDAFVGYHGRKYRGFFIVNWQEGTISGFPGEKMEGGDAGHSHSGHGHEDGKHSDDNAEAANLEDSSSNTIAIATCFAILSASMIAAQLF